METLEGEREEALKEETLAREEALSAANLPFFLAERFFLNTLPLPVGVSFCFLKDVASCLFLLPAQGRPSSSKTLRVAS